MDIDANKKEFVMKNHLSVYTISIIVIFAVLSGCTAIRLIKSTKLSDPKIEFVQHKVGKPSGKKVIVDLELNAYNPNTIGLKNIFINYELYAENKRFLKGDNISLALSPKGDTKITVPVEIIYSDVLNAVGRVLAKTLLGTKNISILVKVTIFGEPTVYNEIEEGALFSFEYQFQKIIEVPIKDEKFKKAEKEIKIKAKIELDKFLKQF